MLRRALQNTSEPITAAADVYSFGMVMWELFTHENPYTPELQTISELDLQLELCRSIRVLNSQHSQIPKKWQDIIFECVDPVAHNRPSLLDILQKIHHTTSAQD
eukprot:TRINITY_DN2190_c0_g1_i4.p1 TRINITY_DN2190_c0_g1~~TRINITY_DN2190_c0_g1_i4.p1  ORF type:complete len:104 (-),score=10.39 TRINITY_DN2190_c0_g1_i4:169-480(-)